MSTLKIGITQGDINGIGYEIILKTLSDKDMLSLFTPILYGSSKAVSYHRKALQITDFNFNTIKHPSEANPKRVNLIESVRNDFVIALGKSSEDAGKASVDALNRGIEDLKNGNIDAIVTAPINKNNIQSDTFNFPGHTEYLQNTFDSKETVMFMISPHLKIGVVTGHIALKDVPERITKENILKKLQIINQSLLLDFNIRKPKIAVLGLNPHAGDDGLLGNEEKEIIVPAIREAIDNNILAMGPFAADGFFGAENYKKYDAVLAMYHDQGLTPFKSIITEEGVNYTAGLPIVRTSPAHGTAYEIAGKSEANPSSFRNAVFHAIDIAKTRKSNAKLLKNQLGNQETDQ
jgi:4-hydroxythreonine-4-phosphate dehydrogenase